MLLYYVYTYSTTYACMNRVTKRGQNSPDFSTFDKLFMQARH